MTDTQDAGRCGLCERLIRPTLSGWEHVTPGVDHEPLPATPPAQPKILRALSTGGLSLLFDEKSPPAQTPVCECAKFIEMWYPETPGYWHRETCSFYRKPSESTIPPAQPAGEGEWLIDTKSGVDWPELYHSKTHLSFSLRVLEDVNELRCLLNKTEADLRAATARAEGYRQALEDSGGVWDGEWHLYSCNLIDRRHTGGLHWCTCEKQRAALNPTKESTSHE